MVTWQEGHGASKGTRPIMCPSSNMFRLLDETWESWVKKIQTIGEVHGRPSPTC